MNTTTPENEGLAWARAAARRYASDVDLPQQQMDQLLGPPLFGPVDIDRDGRPVSAYRWLGGGRGGPYLQAEVDPDLGTVTIYFGAGHEDKPPASYAVDDLGRHETP